MSDTDGTRGPKVAAGCGCSWCMGERSEALQRREAALKTSMSGTVMGRDVMGTVIIPDEERKRREEQVRWAMEAARKRDEARRVADLAERMAVAAVPGVLQMNQARMRVAVKEIVEFARGICGMTPELVEVDFSSKKEEGKE